MFDEGDAPETKSKKVTELLVRTFTPPITLVGLGYREKRLELVRKAEVKRSGLPIEPVREAAGAYGGMLIDFWTPAKIEAVAGKNIAWDLNKQSKRLYQATKKIRSLRNPSEEDWADYQREVERIDNHLNNATVRKKGFDRLVRWFEDNEAELLEQGRALKFILEKQGVDAFREKVNEIRDEIRSKR